MSNFINLPVVAEALFILVLHFWLRLRREQLVIRLGEVCIALEELHWPCLNYQKFTSNCFSYHLPVSASS